MRDPHVSASTLYRMEVPDGLLIPGLHTLLMAVLIPRVVCFDRPVNVRVRLADAGSHATILRDDRLGIAPLLAWREISYVTGLENANRGLA